MSSRPASLCISMDPHQSVKTLEGGYVSHYLFKIEQSYLVLLKVFVSIYSVVLLEVVIKALVYTRYRKANPPNFPAVR